MGDRTKEERKINMRTSGLEGNLENMTLCPVYKLMLGNSI